ncbi:SMP-30/gluconolactonase/LRE family protein [Pollutibacter soli]|uniref:SMP-30/gluconolactonase/LRE family protein n=1 Tax=Pollutibacter soli TaxID=3034157 RepID=UPI003013EF07
MRKVFCVLFCFRVLLSSAQTKTETYPEDPASVVHADVPKGEVLKFTFDSSKFFPGTTREYWVYIPAQYKADQPACVYVNQDGIQWNAPVVMDNLIHRKEMPVTIGVFVMHGKVKAVNGTALDRFNRSYEYDGLGDNYARFLLEELLPEVEKKKATDGRAIRLSKNGNDRAIGGSSSGAVCAFTAAWERPDAFSRVFSAIGTYVGLRGADRYPTLIRKTEPKPIRVFLQDGTNDLNIYAGDWWKANEMMERALVFAGYEVNHVWGEGAHNGAHGKAVFPDAMRWLWKDWPRPVQKGKSQNAFLQQVILENEGWELVGEGYGFTEGTIADKNGVFFFQDIPASKTYKVIENGQPVVINSASDKSSGTAFAPDGSRVETAGGTKQVIRYTTDGKRVIVSDSLSGNDIAIAVNGNMYITSPDGIQNPGRLFLIKPGGTKIEVDKGLRFPNGLTLSPDQTQLYVTESASHWVWVYSILPDGTLANKQKYGWLHVADADENAWSDGLKCDTAGRVWVTTRTGVQIMDQTGRVNAILPFPWKTPSNLCFGGKDRNILYVTCVDKVYRRKFNTKGSDLFSNPTKPQPPRL